MTTYITKDALDERIEDRLVALDIWWMGFDDPVQAAPFGAVADGLLHRPDHLRVLLEIFGSQADAQDIECVRQKARESAGEADCEEGRNVIDAWLERLAN